MQATIKLPERQKRLNDLRLTLGAFALADPTSNPYRSKKRHLRERLYRRSPYCHWCRRRLEWEEATIEHLVRRADGGRSTMDNCTIACGPCNNLRGEETNPARIVAIVQGWREGRRIDRWHDRPVPPRVHEMRALFIAGVEAIEHAVDWQDL